SAPGTAPYSSAQPSPRSSQNERPTRSSPVNAAAAHVFPVLASPASRISGHEMAPVGLRVFSAMFWFPLVVGGMGFLGMTDNRVPQQAAVLVDVGLAGECLGLVVFGGSQFLCGATQGRGEFADDAFIRAGEVVAGTQVGEVLDADGGAPVRQ